MKKKYQLCDPAQEIEKVSNITYENFPYTLLYGSLFEISVAHFV